MPMTRTLRSTETKPMKEAKQHLINIKPLNDYFKNSCKARWDEKPPAIRGLGTQWIDNEDIV